ncbi:hypothetical protein BDN70DRAFT_811133 [Pholiota conissans]|uniref:Ubiquinol-cytochrome c chaperone domain-containing protein n=1 Tax=Pholiota conissans TaxID=109636 RepID=A0A9P5YZZ6_9AGAR|nr:hypothetical protein BDN70DRAFT_811133 [Pholiota conissans]
MVPRSVVLPHLRVSSTSKALRSSYVCRRLVSTQQKPVETSQRPAKSSWLTRKVESSPVAKTAFLGLAKVLGYGSPKQVAGMRAFSMYEQLCAVKPDEDREFWQNACYLPPTFQSWFTITNLHLWLLTVRLRALPAPHGKHYHQALVDHFFLDVEDRIRAVLQPPSTPAAPYTTPSSFYANPTPKKPSRAPDRIVTRQLKIFKEQWAGMGISFDLGLVRGDAEFAAAVWRNLLGARGASGIDYAGEVPFRRAVNLVGGAVVNVEKVDWEAEARRDDASGVSDFPPSEVDRYLTYPELMRDVVGYCRRELKRLESVSDEDIMSGDWTKMKFGRVREV